jgi:hypothetical protein
VAPGVGAVLGAALIAVAAQGSLAEGRVPLPAGPRLSPAVIIAQPVSTAAPAQPGTVVAPVHPVVTQSAATGGTTGVTGPTARAGTPPAVGPASWDGAATTSTESAGAPGAMSEGPATSTTESPTTTTSTTSITTKTTPTTEPEPKDK